MRYRRSRPRAKRNLTWQPMTNTKILTIPAATLTGAVVSGLLLKVSPGVYNGTATVPFDADHVLERIRGSMAHNAQGQESTTLTDWFPFTVAAVKIPKGLTFPATGLNLFENSEIDDFAFRMDAVCNAGTNDAIPNWHDVDSKAKRKFEVGDALQFLWSAVNPGKDNRDKTIEFSMNLRVLWKLT